MWVWSACSHIVRLPSWIMLGRSALAVVCREQVLPIDVLGVVKHGIVAVNYGPSGGPGKETRGTMYIPNLVSCAKVYAFVARDISSKTRDEVRKR